MLCAVAAFACGAALLVAFAFAFGAAVCCGDEVWASWFGADSQGLALAGVAVSTAANSPEAARAGAVVPGLPHAVRVMVSAAAAIAASVVRIGVGPVMGRTVVAGCGESGI